MEVTLAIDYGATRVGLAVSVGWLARPLVVLPHGARASLIEQVLQAAQREGVTRLLVGLPLNADGSEGEQAEIARAFAQELSAQTPLPLFLWNEYGSSQAAQEQLIGANVRRKNRKAKLDAVAAAVFLQEFLEAGDEQVERVSPEGLDDE